MTTSLFTDHWLRTLPAHQFLCSSRPRRGHALLWKIGECSAHSLPAAAEKRTTYVYIFFAPFSSRYIWSVHQPGAVRDRLAAAAADASGGGENPSLPLASGGEEKQERALHLYRLVPAAAFRHFSRLLVLLVIS